MVIYKCNFIVENCMLLDFSVSLPCITENGFKTANGPSESIPKRLPRQRTPRLEPRYLDKDLDSDTSHLSAVRKPPRAKSQPPGNTNQRTSNRENRRSFIRHDWAENHIETRNRQTPNMRVSVSAGEVRTGTQNFCIIIC